MVERDWEGLAMVSLGAGCAVEYRRVEHHDACMNLGVAIGHLYWC